MGMEFSFKGTLLWLVLKGSQREATNFGVPLFGDEQKPHVSMRGSADKLTSCQDILLNPNTSELETALPSPRGTSDN